MSYVKVWGHRGASGYAPENTLEAFQLAIDMKADGIELDVQLTKDGEPVVIHDEVIDRVSNGKGWVKEYTLKELKSFNYNKIHPEYEFAVIPTLGEVYSLLKSTEVYINIELKTGIVYNERIEEKVLKIANDMGMEDRILYSSFNHYSIMKIKKLNSNAKIGFLYRDVFVNIQDYIKRMGGDAVHPSINNLKCPNLAEECRRNGLQINVWNIRDEDIKYCCEVGVNAIITNYPDRTREMVNNLMKG